MSIFTKPPSPLPSTTRRTSFGDPRIDVAVEKLLSLDRHQTSILSPHAFPFVVDKTSMPWSCTALSLHYPLSREYSWRDRNLHRDHVVRKIRAAVHFHLLTWPVLPLETNRPWQWNAHTTLARQEIDDDHCTVNTRALHN